MKKYILSFILILIMASVSLFQGSILAKDVYCYRDPIGEGVFCSSAVLDLEMYGGYPTAADCAMYCGY